MRIRLHFFFAGLGLIAAGPVSGCMSTKHSCNDYALDPDCESTGGASPGGASASTTAGTGLVCCVVGGAGGTGNAAGGNGTGGAADGGAAAGGAPAGGTNAGGTFATGGVATGGVATGGAAPCNGACTGPIPICEVSINQCVACTNDTNCPNNTVCDTGRHVCVGCTKDSHCAGATPACDTTTNTCVPCTKDTNCSGSTPACDTSAHECVECTKSSYCPTTKPQCKTTEPVDGGVDGGAELNVCVECLSDDNCPASKSACTSDNTCVECLASTDCTYSTSKPACKTATRSCVECVTSADCKDPTKSVCDTAANACVGCLASTDCADTTKVGYNVSKLLCKTETKTCVSCLANTDCKTAAASKCDLTTGSATINTCLPCSADTDCTQVSAKNICLTGVTGQANQCVTCTAAKETVCGANSCNPRTYVCTSTPKNSVTLCGACVADSECATGTGITTARCVPMTFGASATPHGSYCLEAVSSGCDRPFSSTLATVVTAASASGAASADYCGINQELVTCEAIRDMQDVNDSVRCTNTNTSQPDDTLCGCTRNALGTCTAPGSGGLCRSISGANRCTIQCGGGSDCRSGYTCTTTNSPNYCG